MKLKGDKCSRCEKEADLYPFRWADEITYRRRTIRRPWLCIGCTKIEKQKLWEKHAAAPW